jgi:outer membrane lipoprotein-sorting protein
MNRRTLLTVAVVALLATSGCTSLDLFEGGTEAPPDVNVAQRYDSLETIQATQVSSLTSDGETNKTKIRVRADFTGENPLQHQRVLAPPERAGDRTVVNESAAVIYDASENAVTHVPRMNGTQRQSRGEYFAEIVAAARSDDAEAPATGVSPLPVVPATGSASTVPGEAIEGFEVEYLGTQTVSGRTTHGFELTSASEAALSVNRTLWLDSEFYYPLKTHQTLHTGNRTIEVTAELTNVTFNAEIPDETFAFDPPANATVETLNISSQTFDSIAAVREHANFSVPEPTVPEEYEFQRARYIGGNATQANLQYENADGDQLAVTKMTYVSNASATFSAGENVTVAGQEARYVTTGTTRILTWKCEDSQFSIVATDLDQDQLIAVAESVGCE